MKTTALLILTLAATSVHAVSAPNTFVSGQPAIAADVNENFDVIATGVNDNTDAIAAMTGTKTWRVVDATGYQLGAMLDFELTSGNLKVMSDKGFQMTMTSDGKIKRGTSGRLDMYFVSNDCSGDPYLLTEKPNSGDGGSFSIYKQLPYFVFDIVTEENFAEVRTRYYPEDIVTTGLTFESYRQTQNNPYVTTTTPTGEIVPLPILPDCNEFTNYGGTPVTEPAYRVLPNDETVTGIRNQAFGETLPISRSYQ